ncbi:MAG TPA: hypothetical protein ENK16_07830 [Chromatiales bacterium]|nr:hypothetical protein [Chromatiales bacterium]
MLLSVVMISLTGCAGLEPVSTGGAMNDLDASRDQRNLLADFGKSTDAGTQQDASGQLPDDYDEFLAWKRQQEYQEYLRWKQQRIDAGKQGDN